MQRDTLLKKIQDQEIFTKEEIITLLNFPSDSFEAYLIMAEANRISKELTNNQAEIHAQFSLNLGTCSCNCLFCSFAEVNHIFNESSEISPAEAVEMAKLFEKEKANAIFVMTTANYPFGKYLEISKEIKKNLLPQTTLIANIGDRNYNEAKALKDAGFHGVYHALRLCEGLNTGIKPELRKTSIQNFQEAGLIVGTCVEPIGPEHSNEQLTDMILYTASLKPAFSGAARRISIQGTKLEKLGMISELRMAQIVAVTRLVMPRSVAGNCTHEPCTLGALAGANLFWAEAGANPRDVEAETEKGRGTSIGYCQKLFEESGWRVLEGKSLFYHC